MKTFPANELRRPFLYRTTRLTAPLRPLDLLAVVSPKRFATNSAIIESKTPLTPNSAKLTITTPVGWNAHVPGQFVVIGVELDGVRHSRCYSITSAPTKRNKTIEIAVHANPDGFVSKHLVESAKVGDKIFVGAATGEFTLEAAKGNSIAIFTGGSGVTPAIGLLRDNATRPNPVDIFMVHHAPTLVDTMYLAELQELAFEHEWLTLELAFTQEGGSRIDIARLDSICPTWSQRDLFACGPEALIDDVVAMADSRSCLENLHLERFKPPTRKDEIAGISSGANVEMLRSNKIVEVAAGATILESLEESGAKPASGCRMGICHTCTTKLVSGCATDTRDGSTVSEGSHVQICIATATEDLTLDI